MSGGKNPKAHVKPADRGSRAGSPRADAGLDPKEAFKQAVDAASADPSVPKLYANGFALSLTNADVFLLFQLSGNPIAFLHMSYTLAKTLQQRLAVAVSQFEAAADTRLLTTSQVDEAFKTQNASSDPANANKGEGSVSV